LIKEAAEGERCAFFWVLSLRLVTTGIEHRKSYFSWAFFADFLHEPALFVFVRRLPKEKIKKQHLRWDVHFDGIMDGRMFIQKKSDLSAKALASWG
jgi:hypothetical protein